MTPDDYPALDAEARDKPAFSNSDEGIAFMTRWCDQCIHDKPARHGDEGNGCPLVLISLNDKRPIQWIDKPADAQGRIPMSRYECIEYRREDDGPGPEPRPVPDPPGQLSLVPRDQYEGVRMYAATWPIRQEATR